MALGLPARRGEGREGAAALMSRCRKMRFSSSSFCFTAGKLASPSSLLSASAPLLAFLLFWRAELPVFSPPVASSAPQAAADDARALHVAQMQILVQRAVVHAGTSLFANFAVVAFSLSSFPSASFA